MTNLRNPSLEFSPDTDAGEVLRGSAVIEVKVALEGSAIWAMSFFPFLVSSAVLPSEEIEISASVWANQ